MTTRCENHGWTRSPNDQCPGCVIERACGHGLLAQEVEAAAGLALRLIGAKPGDWHDRAIRKVARLRDWDAAMAFARGWQR